MSKRGFPNTLAPDVQAEMERLWVRTGLPQIEIAARLNKRFGTSFEPKNIEWHARRRCWNREMMSKSSNNRHLVEDRLLTKSFLRWAEPKVRDNAVKLVQPGTHPARGFRLGAGQ